MFPFLGILLGGVTSVFKGLFGMKQSQAQVIQKAIEVVGAEVANETPRLQAMAAVAQAEASSGSYLANNWRPFFYVVCIAIVISYWFGYSPPNLNGPMPPMVDRLFSLIEVGLSFGIGARSLEKIVTNLNLGSVIKTFIEKKIL